MSLWRLFKSSLVFYWRTNTGVLLAALVATSVLAGALLVGDSVRYSLGRLVTVRLGKVELAVAGQNRFFRARLADDLAGELDAEVSPVLHLRGLIANSEGTRRANSVEVLGVDERFFRLGAETNPVAGDFQETVILNKPLAQRLGATAGDEVMLRIGKPGFMPRDIPLTPDSDLSVGVRLAVGAIADESQFGSFSLEANQVSPLNVFVPLEWLGRISGQQSNANMLLVGTSTEEGTTVERANKAIKKSCQLADLGLEVRRVAKGEELEVRSRRVFVDDFLAQAAMKAGEDVVGILTYFVNEIRHGDKAAPYSFVTAMGPGGGADALVQPGMKDDEILINQWLGDDLGAGRGDEVSISYFVVGAGRKLEERKSTFKVLDVLGTDEAGDAELMPDFPGLADEVNCRDWKPGIPIDVDKIRDKDEAYWDRYRGVPKAFVTLSAGQKMWGNRFGNLTAVRYRSGKVSEQSIADSLLREVDVSRAGLYFQQVRVRGLKASREATDFGQLFLGLSMFLIASAVILLGLVFVFGVEKRTEQAGMLLAVGFPPKLVKRLLLAEGGVLAVFGAIAGAGLGIVYTKVMIHGLGTVWQGAVGGSAIHFDAKLLTIIAGAAGGVLVSFASIWVALRKQLRQPARELLCGTRGVRLAPGVGWRSRFGLWIAIAAGIGAAALIFSMPEEKSGAFFGAGALLLIGEIGLGLTVLKSIGGRWTRPVKSLGGLGVRNCARRRGRSLAVLGLLAAGSFLVVAVGANRKDPFADSQKRASGTGGFALFAQSSMPISRDLNSASERSRLGLDDEGLETVRIVPLRVHAGDDASCLNLNRAQRPRVLGVQPEQLKQRGAFGFMQTIEGTDIAESWDLLKRQYDEGVVPAIADYTTIVWAIGKKMGDELEYVDEMGRKFKLRIVGMLKNSILQGSMIIADDDFVRHFPSEDGYRVFLIDAPEQKADKTGIEISKGLQDFGVDVVSSAERLAQFNTVENTYLSIFSLLGGLGLILGTVGLGLVVFLNVLDRRGEMAMLRAVGFDKKMLMQMVLYEHGGLMLAGLLGGVAAAIVAIGPVLRSPGAEAPYVPLAITIGAVAASGFLWIWFGTAFTLSGRALEALRNE
ncbi:MAG: FtsX-like permease family protein [Planctomycetota bacterium]|jgi:ABC-type antimicrobial peptide transport system permease subunit